MNAGLAETLLRLMSWAAVAPRPIVDGIMAAGGLCKSGGRLLVGTRGWCGVGDSRGGGVIVMVVVMRDARDNEAGVWGRGR